MFEITIRGIVKKTLPVESYTNQKTGVVTKTKQLEFETEDSYSHKTVQRYVRVPADLELKPDKDGIVTLVGNIEPKTYVSALKQYVGATIYEFKKDS